MAESSSFRSTENWLEGHCGPFYARLASRQKSSLHWSDEELSRAGPLYVGNYSGLKRDTQPPVDSGRDLK